MFLAQSCRGKCCAKAAISACTVGWQNAGPPGPESCPTCSLTWYTLSPASCTVASSSDSDWRGTSARLRKNWTCRYFVCLSPCDDTTGFKCNATTGLWTDDQNKSGHIVIYIQLFSLCENNVFVCVRVCAQMPLCLHKAPKLCLPNVQAILITIPHL